MHRFLAIFERDLRKFIRNPLVVAMSLLMPIIYLVILGNSFQGELKNLPVAVVDLDSGPYSRKIMELLAAVEAGPATLELVRVADQGFAMEGLRQGVFKAAIVIPGGFSRDVMRRRLSEVGLYLDNAETISAMTIRASVTAALSELRDEFVSIREERGEFRLRDMELYRKIDYDQTLIPGVVIMAIFLGAMTTGAFNMVMDKFLGVEESYFLTPLSKTDIVMGLIASGLLITTVLALVVLFLGSLMSGLFFWGGMTFMTFVLMLAVIVLSTLGLQGLMFMIMGRINHPRIVGVLGGFLNVILFFPSGAIYPIESFPGWLKAFAAVNPETYSVHAMRALLFKGAGLQAVQGDLVFLAVFAVFSVLFGMLAFKRAL
ncbi:putative multidrug ABC transporter permease YbhR [uncultured bacterium]|nr:putative multidrug ABC transporter permease YbhR [uncultured bacterium]